MEKSVVLERVYVVPLRRAWNSAYHKRTRKAVRMLKEFAYRHMKSEVVKIDGDLNKYIWRRGNANPPRKIKVVMIKYDNGEVLIKKYEDTKTSEKPSKKDTEKKSESKEKETAPKEVKNKEEKPTTKQASNKKAKK